MIALRTIFGHAEQIERVEMFGRELEQLAVYRLRVRNQSGLLQRHRALEQPGHLRLL